MAGGCTTERECVCSHMCMYLSSSEKSSVSSAALESGRRVDTHVMGDARHAVCLEVPGFSTYVSIKETQEARDGNRNQQESDLRLGAR